MRLAELDVPASHLLIKGKPKEAFTSYAPKLTEALSKYCSLKGQGRAALFFKQESVMLVMLSIILEIAQLIPTANKFAGICFRSQ